MLCPGRKRLSGGGGLRDVVKGKKRKGVFQDALEIMENIKTNTHQSLSTKRAKIRVEWMCKNLWRVGRWFSQ